MSSLKFNSLDRIQCFHHKLLVSYFDSALFMAGLKNGFDGNNNNYLLAIA